MSDESIIVDLLKELRTQSDETAKSVDGLDKKMDLHIQKTEYEFASIRALDDTQNKILAEHVAGVNTLKEMHQLQREEFEARLKNTDKRIETLEEPRKWLQNTKSLILWLAALCGGIMTILHFFK